MPSKKPFAGWDPDSPLEALALETEQHYYSLDRSPFGQFPEAVERRCWDLLRSDPLHKAAAEILFNVLRARLEVTGDLTHAGALKQLQDAVGRDGSAPTSKYGNTLVNHFQPVLRRGMAARGISQSDLESEPIGGIEEAFGTDQCGAEGHRLAGLVQAGYRGLVADDPETMLYAIALGLREAFHFFRAGQLSLADGSLDWADRRLGACEDALADGQRLMVGRLYKMAAIGARDAHHSDDLITRLERARSFLPSHGEDQAECWFELGREHERRGDLYEAVSCYEKALETPGVDNPQLIDAIRACKGSLLAEAEGDLDQWLPPGRAGGATFGDDPDSIAALREIGARLANEETPSEETLLEAIRALRTRLANWRGDRPHDRVLFVYVFLLKLGLSLPRQDRLPFAFGDVIAEAEPYLAGANPGTVLEFEQVKAAVEQLATAMPPHLQPWETGGPPRLPDLFEPQPRRPPPGSSDR